MVVHRTSAPYHPHANGQAKSTNKTLCKALTKVVEGNQTDWEQKLHGVLWAYRNAYKAAIGTTPFNLVYRLDAILPIEFFVLTLQVAQTLNWTDYEFLKRNDELKTLDKIRLQVVIAMYTEKCHQKRWHDENVIIQKGYLGSCVPNEAT